MYALASLYIEMEKQERLFLSLAGDRTEKTLTRNEESLGRCLDLIGRLSEESMKAAFLLPPLAGDDKFLLLHGVTAKMKGGALDYHIRPVICHNNGDGAPTRAIDLFCGELGLDYDPEKPWRENVGAVAAFHRKARATLAVLSGGKSGAISSADFLISACDTIAAADSRVIRANLVTVRDVRAAAEKMKAERLRTSATRIRVSGSGVSKSGRAEERCLTVPPPVPSGRGR